MSRPTLYLVGGSRPRPRPRRRSSLTFARAFHRFMLFWFLAVLGLGIGLSAFHAPSWERSVAWGFTIPAAFLGFMLARWTRRTRERIQPPR